MLPDHIRITDNITAELDKFLSKRKYSKVAVLLDENTAQHCYPLVQEIVGDNLIVVSSGEKHKNLATCEQIWKSMTGFQLDRHSVLIIIGGGVLGDMGGFCAATYKRGIDFILIPTTLLSQVDASIGGKLGIDFSDFKNHIGLFREPSLNLLHEGFFKSLPANELRSGFAEVIKHTLISDPSMWNEIRIRDLANQDWKRLILHSAEFKSFVVREDPEEKGLRKILNAGHTVGHAVESYFLAEQKPIMHGEAVALGLIAESWIALQRQLLDLESLDQITQYILTIFRKIEIPDKDLKEIANRCLQDKKNKDNKILCVLPDGIGRAQWNVEVSLEEIVESLAFYNSLQM